MKAGTICSRGQLVWCPQWKSFGEGPYTLAAKMLHANSLKARYLRDAIRCRTRIGTSLLDPLLSYSATGSLAEFGRILHQSSLAFRIPNLYRELADDRELRYCAKCMSAGFQAAIAQISGFDRCPIHGEVHRNTCIQCGCKTPPYFLEDSTWLPGFSCRACGAPFGGDVPIDRRFDAWVPPGELYRLDPIHRWLARINDSKVIYWINVSKWNVTRVSSEGADDRKRCAVFRILRSQLVEEDLPESILEQNPRILGSYPVDPNNARKELSAAEYGDILGRLSMPPELRQYRSHLLTPSFGVAVPTNPIVPPELHAHLIWRAQFERVSSVYSQSYSRSE